MEMKEVVSSNIKAIGHDAGAKILHIHFNTGTVYEYENVSEEVYSHLAAAESVGKVFHAKIKGQYPYKKVA